MQDHIINTTYFKAAEYKAKGMLSLEICSDTAEEKILNLKKRERQRGIIARISLIELKLVFPGLKC